MKEIRFPRIKVETLSGKELVLPDDTEGKVVLIGVAFVREAQGMLDSWMDYFKHLCSENEVYELPVIESSFWKVFSGFIDGGMRSGIPREKHDFVGTHYGDASDFVDALNIEDKKLGYVFLVDEKGYIRFRGDGYIDEYSKKAILEQVRGICH